MTLRSHLFSTASFYAIEPSWQGRQNVVRLAEQFLKIQQSFILSYTTRSWISRLQSPERLTLAKEAHTHTRHEVRGL